MITTYDTILRWAMQSWVGDHLDTYSTLPDTQLTIKMEGDNWDGMVDTRVARFVIDAQKDLLNILSYGQTKQTRYFFPYYYPNDYRFALHTTPGSTNFKIKIKELLDMEIAGVKGSLICSTVIAVSLLYFGASSWQTYCDTKKSIEIKAQDEQTKQLIAKQNTQVVEIMSEHSNALTGLINSMRGTDRITLPASQAPLSKTQAIKFYEIPDDIITADYVMIDGGYYVSDHHIEDNMIKIKAFNQYIPLSLDPLNKKDLAKLMDLIKRGRSKPASKLINLRIDAKMIGTKIVSASVVGIGARRPGSKALYHK